MKQTRFSPVPKLDPTQPLETNLRRGTLDLIVLKTLAVFPDNGVGVKRRLREVSQLFPEPTNGSIYPCLRRLQQRRWVGCQLDLTEGHRVGHYYWVNQSGKAALAEQIACWRRYADAVERILATERW